jgi:hypothetical protein
MREAVGQGAAMPSALDPKVVYHRLPLPDEENAYPLWVEACQCSVPPPRLSSDEEVPGLNTAGCGPAWSSDQPGLPEGEDGARLLVWIEQNRRALDLIEAGIDRGRLQFPDIRCPEEFNRGRELILALRDLSRARSMRIRQFLTRGDDAQAVNDAVRLLQIGDMYSNGDGIVIDYLAGMALAGIGTDRIRRLAKRQISEFLLQKLLSVVEVSLNSPDGLAHSILVDCWKTAAPRIRRMPDEGSLEQIVDGLLSECYSDGPLTCDSPPLPDAQERISWRRSRILELFDGHPRLFDEAATLALLEQRLADVMAEIASACDGFGWRVRGLLQRRSRLSRSQSLARETSIWPSQLAPGYPLEWCGEHERARHEIGEIGELLMAFGGESAEPLSRHDLEIAREKLRRITNPIGAMMVQYRGPDTIAIPAMINRRSTLSAVKALLAIRIFEERTGKLPAALSDLVKQRIINTLPQDPYSGGPLRYCPRRQIVWCVGKNGRNRRGDLPHEPHAPGHVLRWEITQPKR